jgi:hypothetical protein
LIPGIWLGDSRRSERLPKETQAGMPDAKIFSFAVSRQLFGADSQPSPQSQIIQSSAAGRPANL